MASLGTDLQSAQPMDSAAANIAKVLLEQCDLELIDISELQTLWAGYGSIYAIKARRREEQQTIHGTEDLAKLVMKIIDPPNGSDKGKDESHVRKMLSYDVEQYFYDEIAPRLNRDEVAVAKCVASSYKLKEALAGNLHTRQNLIATVLTDLRVEFSVAGEKRSVLSSRQVYAAIDWLAKFHKSSKHISLETSDLLLPPQEEFKRRQSKRKHPGRSLWLNGGYTYLATRQSEYRRLFTEHSEWATAFCTPLQSSSNSTIAELVARFLVPVGRPFETCIHGDVKSENLFSNELGDKVAFFDFQYTGLGLGVCDLAKLFTCSVPLSMLVSQSSDSAAKALEMDGGEKALLTLYWNTFQQHDASLTDYQYGWDIFVRHWETALVDWCRFQASWGFWGNTNWLQARVRSILADEEWLAWISVQEHHRIATEARNA